MYNRTTLLHMLTYARPCGSDSEAAFIARFLTPLPGWTVDAYGNGHVLIGDSPILWSCHTDTVHRTGGRQTIHVDAQGVVSLSKRSKRYGAACLGADDTVGVFLCQQMILAGIPGHYIFHYGEEWGGLGSSNLAQYAPELLAGAQCAIALDRKGTGDVITHQYGRCCSDAFAESLTVQLNAHGMEYAPSDRGVFTDTANYTDIVGECTNISIGYADCHTNRESIDLSFVERLFHALCSIDVSQLVNERIAGTVEAYDYGIVGWDWGQGKVLPFERIIECQYCGLDYDPLDSDAIDSGAYCQEMCERESTDLVRDRAIYLDPERADIQQLLYRQAARSYYR